MGGRGFPDDNHLEPLVPFKLRLSKLPHTLYIYWYINSSQYLVKLNVHERSPYGQTVCHNTRVCDRHMTRHAGCSESGVVIHHRGSSKCEVFKKKVISKVNQMLCNVSQLRIPIQKMKMEIQSLIMHRCDSIYFLVFEIFFCFPIGCNVCPMVTAIFLFPIAINI